MIQIPKSVQLLTKGTKKRKAKEVEVDKEVHSELREQKYIPIKKFYPIYSVTPDAWQADITYLRADPRTGLRFFLFHVRLGKILIL